MPVELTPEQPEEVVRAIESVVGTGERERDAWWRAGIEETLYGETTARPRSTLGADLA